MFGDKDATFGESQPYLKVLTDRLDRTPDATYCEGLYEDKIFWSTGRHSNNCNRDRQLGALYARDSTNLQSAGQRRGIGSDACPVLEG
jgi:hypothetical protein